MLKKQFIIACASAGTNLSQWAHENKVTPQFVCQLVSGTRKSRRIRAKIDKFIRREFQKLRFNADTDKAA
jgi:hypothetical protein